MGRPGLGALLGLLAWAGCSAPGPAVTTGPRPPIVIVSLDTLRADHVSAWGYGRPTSPRLDAFAREAVRFEHAYAQSTGTLLSHLSLLTSLHPPHFRITRDDGKNVSQGETRLRLPEAVETLAEVLRAGGYDTIAITDGGLVSERYGFGQGFDHFEVNPGLPSRGQGGLRTTLPKLRARLDARAARGSAGEPAAPLFLFLHSYDVHGPYDAPEPFAKAFSRGSYAELGAELGFAPEPGKLNGALAEVTPAQVDEVVALYDNGIAATDAQLEPLFALLREHGLYDEAVLVLLSDHGEEFLEHGSFSHGPKVYAELVHVPLLVRLPGARHGGRVVREPVALLDVAPTLVELAGLEVPEAFAGRSLLGAIEAGAAEAERPIFFDVSHRGWDVHGMRRGRWKVIRNGAQGAVELYDVEADPGERTDLAQAEAKRAERMAAELADWVARMEREGLSRGWFAVPATGTDENLSPDERRALRELGYIE